MLRNRTLDWEDALWILFGDREPSSHAPFRSGADVCASLAEHFGFGDYSGLEELRRETPVESGSNEVLTRRDFARLFVQAHEELGLSWGLDKHILRAVYAHFGIDDYAAAANEPPVADLEVLLCGLEVESLEQLRFYVEAGKRTAARGPVVVV